MAQQVADAEEDPALVVALPDANGIPFGGAAGAAGGDGGTSVPGGYLPADLSTFSGFLHEHGDGFPFACGERCRD